MGSMRFRTPGYDQALVLFIQRVVDGVVALDPVLADIPIRQSVHGGPTRSAADSNNIDIPLTHFDHEVKIHHDVYRHSRIDDYIAILYELGERHREELGKTLVQTLIATTEAEGNSMTSGGRPLSWELIPELIDAIDLQFDEDGNLLSKPTVLLSPTDAAKLETIPRPKDLDRMIERVINSKREKFFAQKHSRRLS